MKRAAAGLGAPRRQTIYRRGGASDGSSLGRGAGGPRGRGANGGGERSKRARAAEGAGRGSGVQSGWGGRLRSGALTIVGEAEGDRAEIVNFHATCWPRRCLPAGKCFPRRLPASLATARPPAWLPAERRGGEGRAGPGAGAGRAGRAGQGWDSAGPPGVEWRRQAGGAAGCQRGR